jgi:hypothetical protein
MWKFNRADSLTRPHRQHITPFKHTGFTPSTTDSWTEYWFPVMKTGGFVKANDFGALNVRASNGQLLIDFSSLQEIKDTSRYLKVNGSYIIKRSN